MITTLMMAVTVDGKIGRGSDHFPDWTGSADKKLFARLSRQAGVVIMGSKTFDTFGFPLPGRKNVILTRNRSRRSRWDNLVYTDRSPAALLQDLEAEGYTRALLAGGATVNTLFAREGLIDEIVVTVCPLLFGTGVSLFAESLDVSLELTEVDRIDEKRVVLFYRVLH
ncbi:MAG: dihydrofolate reductase family protein [Desulfobacteraceae bacterium]|nr:dihydrofolate reductase family protein [Desulfobacteraceae bacterium]